MMARSVLIMEAITMGFALLLVRLENNSSDLAIGGAIAIALILTSGLLKKRWGWWLGSALQLATLLYGFVITSMFIMGAIFTALWFAAIFLGRKGERIRSELEAQAKKSSGAPASQ
jgi:hypothetical protein